MEIVLPATMTLTLGAGIALITALVSIIGVYFDCGPSQVNTVA